MPRLKVSNNFGVTLSEDVTSLSNIFKVNSVLKVPSAPFRLTVFEVDTNGNETIKEIVEVGEVDTINNQLQKIVRGLEGTSPTSHKAGVRLENRFTAETYDELEGDCVRVKDFGAVGNANYYNPATDMWYVDSSFIFPASDNRWLIQDALNKAGGKVVSFESGKKYYISDFVIADANKVRGIEANNAHLIIKNDVVALKYFGNLTNQATGNPDSQAKEVAIAELNPYINNLRVHSAYETVVGTGIQISGVFFINIRGCNLFRLRHGIEIIGRNRNIIIMGNNIWHCQGYGIHYNHTSLHQNVINSNHISYCRKNIFIENCDMHNMQIVGNDIEAHSAANKVTIRENSIHIKIAYGATSVSHEGIQIVGNTLEDHYSLSGATILIENGLRPSTEKTHTIAIVGNEIGNSAKHAIEIIRARGLAIVGNNFRYSKDYMIKLMNGFSYNTNISGNTFAGSGDPTSPDSSGGTGGLLWITNEVDSVEGVAENIYTAFMFNNNTAENVFKNPIRIDGAVNAGFANKGTYLDSFQMCNNIIHIKPSAVITGYLVDIGISSTEATSEVRKLENFSFKDNIIKAHANCDNGVRIRAREYGLAIIKDNMISGLSSTKTKYDLPSPVPGKIVVNDNLAS